MRTELWNLVLTLMAFCLTSCFLRQGPRQQSSQGAVPRPTSPMAAKGKSPSEVAAREARHWHGQAMEKLNEDRQALEDWDPQADGTTDLREWQHQMAQDRIGYLERALVAAERAVRLARTPAEVYQATAVRARLECDRGNHEAEQQHAERLMALDPGNPLSRLWLQRAKRCLHMAQREAPGNTSRTGRAD
jgi:tetratricopeptide (TPR) repeat protein